MQKISGTLIIPRKNYNGCGSVADLLILRLGDLHERLSSRMNNIEQFHNSGTVVRDGGSATAPDKLIHSTGTQSGSNSVHNSMAGINIRN